jgi:DNA-binding FrmR family transcriptional regulator
VEDITEEYLDIHSRIRAKKELEKRYLQLIGQAKKVSEMLEIERELGQIRSEIESLEGKINYMSNQVSYSTLSIRFYKNIEGKTEFSRKLTMAFEDGMDTIKSSSLLIISLWPVLILLGLVTAGIRMFRRRKLKLKGGL